MNLSKDKINEYIELYLNDLSDYGDDDEHGLAESILNPFKTTLDESEGNTYDILKEASKQSPEHKQIVVEFLEYLQHTQNTLSENKIEVKNLSTYQQYLDGTRFSSKDRMFYQSIINTIKNQSNLASPKQYDILQKIKKGLS